MLFTLFLYFYIAFTELYIIMALSFQLYFFLQIATMEMEKTTEAWSAKLVRGSPARNGTSTHLIGQSTMIIQNER